MDFSAALPTFIITLREGVEAALVVGIVLACLKKANQDRLSDWAFGGILVGLVASAIVGTALSKLLQTVGSIQQYGPVLEPLLEAGFGLVAIVLLSWMLIWMTQQSWMLKSNLESAVGDALQSKYRSGWAVFNLTLFAVLREGFETVFFVMGRFQQGIAPAIGAVLGVISAAAIGLALFRWGIRLNIKRFFQVMGVFLILIVAGLSVTTLTNFDAAIQALAGLNRQSASLCFFYERFARHPSCMLGGQIWDFSQTLPMDKFPGIFFSALLGYTDRLYMSQAIGYIGVLLTVGSLYWRGINITAPPPARRFTDDQPRPSAIKRSTTSLD
jgi:high-affinity iron transporter